MKQRWRGLPRMLSFQCHEHRSGSTELDAHASARVQHSRVFRALSTAEYVVVFSGFSLKKKLSVKSHITSLKPRGNTRATPFMHPFVPGNIKPLLCTLHIIYTLLSDFPLVLFHASMQSKRPAAIDPLLLAAHGARRRRRG